jgi:hypothetical protein
MHVLVNDEVLASSFVDNHRCLCSFSFPLVLESFTRDRPTYSTSLANSVKRGFNAFVALDWYCGLTQELQLD